MHFLTYLHLTRELRETGDVWNVLESHHTFPTRLWKPQSLFLDKRLELKIHKDGYTYTIQTAETNFSIKLPQILLGKQQWQHTYPSPPSTHILPPSLADKTTLFAPSLCGNTTQKKILVAKQLIQRQACRDEIS